MTKNELKYMEERFTIFGIASQPEIKKGLMLGYIYALQDTHILTKQEAEEIRQEITERFKTNA